MFCVWTKTSSKRERDSEYNIIKATTESVSQTGHFPAFCKKKRWAKITKKQTKFFFEWSELFQFSYFIHSTRTKEQTEKWNEKRRLKCAFLVATQFVYSIKSKNIWFIFNNVANNVVRAWVCMQNRKRERHREREREWEGKSKHFGCHFYSRLVERPFRNKSNRSFSKSFQALKHYSNRNTKQPRIECNLRVLT